MASAFLVGDALALASATCFAISNVTIARGARDREDNGAFVSLLLTAAISGAGWLAVGLGRGFEPVTGRALLWFAGAGVLTAFEIPAAPGVRVDAGYAPGSEVSTFYDAMLAKVVAHAATRSEAARTLAGALARARIHGVRTNREQLVAVLRDPDFLSGAVSTAFLDEHQRPVHQLVIPGFARLDQQI